MGLNFTQICLILNFILRSPSDLPQLDELAWSEPKGELPLLRPQQWTYPFPGIVDDDDDDDDADYDDNMGVS